MITYEVVWFTLTFSWCLKYYITRAAVGKFGMEWKNGNGKKMEMENGKEKKWKGKFSKIEKI